MIVGGRYRAEGNKGEKKWDNCNSIKNKIYFKKWYWKIWTATCKKKMKFDNQLTPYTKINSRWIKDLNISHDKIKVIEENIGRKTSDIPCNNIFTNMFPRARDMMERKNKFFPIQLVPFLFWDFIKIESFCMAKAK